MEFASGLAGGARLAGGSHSRPITSSGHGSRRCSEHHCTKHSSWRMNLPDSWWIAALGHPRCFRYVDSKLRCLLRVGPPSSLCQSRSQVLMPSPTTAPVPFELILRKSSTRV
jgi:hypothetical protein